MTPTNLPYDSGSDTDATEQLLRQALAAEAGDIQPDPDALLAIQQRTGSAAAPLGDSSDRARPVPAGSTRTILGGRGRSWGLATLGAGVATAAVIATVVVIGDQAADPSRTPVAGPRQTTGQATTVPTEPADATASTSATPAGSMHPGVYDPDAPVENQVAMYYLGADAPRLYTEVHTVLPATGGSPVLAAVHEFLTSTPLDPDYRSGWPAGVDVVSITQRNGKSIVTLDGAESFLTPDPGYLNVDAQLLRSVRAMLATAGVDQAMLRTGGLTVGPFATPSDDDVRAWVSITSPVEGQTVDSPVTVTGSANVFEANVNWELLDQRGDTIDSGYAMAGFTEWKPFTIDLGTIDPGTYTIRTFESSPKDGRPTFVDDKTFTVR